MHDPKELIIHCLDTRTDQDFDIEDVRRWHVDDFGWNDVGYHWVIKLDGTIQYGRSIYTNGAHCSGKNDELGLAFEGGKKPDGSKWDNFTEKQIESFKKLYASIKLTMGRELKIIPHSAYSSKTCPNCPINPLL